jgi:hypothetical protein
MRYGSLASLILAGACLSLSQAQAQQRPGWVDPPARPAAEPERTPPAAAAPKETPTAAKPASPSEPPADLAEGRPTPSARSPRRRETAREERVPERSEGRRLARTPPLAPPPATAEALDPRYAGWAAAAQRLTFDYLDSVSGPDSASPATARRFYAERVRRFGRVVPLSAVIAEKRNFAQRWPERRYEAQDGATRTACSAAAASCIVRTVYDYRADAPARGARSQGTAELVLEISFAGERPLIVAESSRVLRRYAPGPLSAAGPTRRGA